MRKLIAAYLAALVVLLAVAVAGGTLLLLEDADNGAEAAAEQHSFNLADWELQHFPEKWLYKIGDFLVGHDEEGSEDEVLERYFILVSEIARLERDEPDSPKMATAERERARLENSVEDIIEGRVTAVLKDQDLTMGPPPFTDLDMVFPPVDFEFDSPPRVLAVSPRDRIALEDDYLLTPGLDAGQIADIEAEAESAGRVSALVVQSGGVATYPSVVSQFKSYESLVDTVFHEWLHQYLVFFPLGSNYFSGSELRTLNESVANIGGRELARLYFERYSRLEQPPRPAPTPAPVAPPEPPDEPFDFTREMRGLRVDVERLLAAGQVQEAEALMAEKRDEFEENGVYIRRLNQAYFAFYGFYADTPASVDPIGPKLEAILADAGSPGEFIRAVYGVTSAAELEELID